MAASRHHLAEIAVGGELVHVGVDQDHEGLAALAQRPMHGVALVEARAEHQEAVELAAEQRAGGVAGAAVAEHAERQLMVLGEHAFGPQRGRDRQRPALRHLLESRRRRVMLDAGAGQDGNAGLAAARIREQRERRFGRLPAQRLRLGEEAADLDVIRRAFAGERVVHQREVHRPARLRPHDGQRMAEPMIEILGVGDGLRQARQRRHHGGVVERRLAGVLECAASFHVDRHLAGHHQHGRAVGLGGRDRGRHVACARPADPDRRAEAAFRPRVAVRHVGGAALVRGDHRLELVLPGERRQERIDQAARDHEQVAEALLREGVEDVVGAERHGDAVGWLASQRASAIGSSADCVRARLMDFLESGD